MSEKTEDRLEEVAMLIGSFVVVDDNGGPDTEVLHDVIGGDYDEATRRVYALAAAIDALYSQAAEAEVLSLRGALEQAALCIEEAANIFPGLNYPSLGEIFAKAAVSARSALLDGVGRMGSSLVSTDMSAPSAPSVDAEGL